MDRTRDEKIYRKRKWRSSVVRPSICQWFLTVAVNKNKFASLTIIYLSFLFFFLSICYSHFFFFMEMNINWFFQIKSGRIINDRIWSCQSSIEKNNQKNLLRKISIRYSNFSNIQERKRKYRRYWQEKRSHETHRSP